MKIQNGFVSHITMGNVTLELTKSKLLTATALAAKYDTFKFNNGNYVVPNGKKLIIRAQRLLIDGAVGIGGPVIGYGDTGVSNSVAPPANYTAVILGGGYNFLGINIQTDDRQEFAIYAEIPAGKYPCIFTAGASVCSFLCEEVLA